MQKKKPYSFIIYENEYSVKNAIDSLQGKIIEINDSQTPMCYYLLPVDGGKILWLIKKYASIYYKLISSARTL